MTSVLEIYLAADDEGVDIHAGVRGAGDHDEEHESAVVNIPGADGKIGSDENLHGLGEASASNETTNRL